MSRDKDFAADLAKYPKRPFMREQSIWAIATYRFGRRVDKLKPGLRRKLLTKIYWLRFRIIETITGITLPKEAQIGPGLRIHHFGNIVVHPRTKIGANCTLRHGVTIGTRIEKGPVPVIEDDVDFGAHSQVYGQVRIGRGAKIGAMTLVLKDVPAGATAVGVPARNILPKSTSEKPGGISP